MTAPQVVMEKQQVQIGISETIQNKEGSLLSKTVRWFRGEGESEEISILKTALAIGLIAVLFFTVFGNILTYYAWQEWNRQTDEKTMVAQISQEVPLQETQSNKQNINPSNDVQIKDPSIQEQAPVQPIQEKIIENKISEVKQPSESTNETNSTKMISRRHSVSTPTCKIKDKENQKVKLDKIEEEKDQAKKDGDGVIPAKQKGNQEVPPVNRLNRALSDANYLNRSVTAVTMPSPKPPELLNKQNSSKLSSSSLFNVSQLFNKHPNQDEWMARAKERQSMIGTLSKPVPKFGSINPPIVKENTNPYS